MDERRYKDFWLFMKLLSDNRLLDHVMIVGSWAEYLYAQAQLLPGFGANLRTLDIDFLVKNMKKPSPPLNIVSLAKDAGYTVDYDLLNETTKIYTPGLMEVEFLISQQGAGENNVLSTNLGVKAQALRHMAMLQENPVQIHLFDMDITVPQPEAYALHKIVERGNKAEKDYAAIRTLLPFLGQEEAARLYRRLTRKEQKTVRAFFNEHADLDWAHVFTS